MEKNVENKKNFIPILLGSDLNAYGMATAFHMAYNLKSLVISKYINPETNYSEICELKIIKDFTNQEVFIKSMIELAKSLQNEYEKLLLISCADGYTELIVNNQKELEKYFITPYVDRSLKEKLEYKADFYDMCEKYNLDYPATYIVTKDNTDLINLDLNFPVVLKPNDSIEYLSCEFEDKQKSYKFEELEPLKMIIKRIFESGYNNTLVIQDFIPGDASLAYVMNCYSNGDGKVKSMCLSNCVYPDKNPLWIGNYDALFSIYNQELFDQIQKFLEEIKFIGFSNFDIKYDYRDQKYKLFEINIRQGRSSFISTVSGCNLAEEVVEDRIFNKDHKIKYNKDGYLWTQVPKFILMKYIKDKELKRKVKKAYAEGNVKWATTYSKDLSFRRIIHIMIIRLRKIRTAYKYKDEV